MASTVGVRRSPRSIEHLCNGILIPYLSYEQTAVVLALAHCTGWSADAISNKLEGAAGIKLSPEEVYDYHRDWISGRNHVESLSPAHWDVMQVLMRNIEVEVGKPARPLSQTLRPITVTFAEKWSAKNIQRRPLFAGWTVFIREVTKGYLMREDNPELYGKLTPYEERAMAKFGEDMLCVIRATLKEWAHAMDEIVNAEPGLRPIRERKHVDLIMKYLKFFQWAYEERFGKMESGKHSSAFGDVQDHTVFIKSTGYGVKVLMGLIMADRMHVVERKRKMARERIGFMLVEATDLEKHSENCPICQEPMGVESVDGAKEDPLRMVICCGQVIGGQCLKTWLSETVFDIHRNTCPVCRFEFPTSFVERLFTVEEYIARIASANQRLDLQSPSPGSAGPMRSQQEHDAVLQQEFGIGDELNERSEPMDVDRFTEVERRPEGARQPVSHQVVLGDPMDEEGMEDEFLMEG